MQAAQRGEPQPAPPWPAHLEAEDDVNAWIYEANRQRPLQDVLDDMHQTLHQLLTFVEGLPDDTRVELVEPAFYLLWIGDQRFLATEFFDHFRDDHEPDVRAWLARVG